MPNKNRKILIGISGGIAAYKSAHLVRLANKAGLEVQVVMTKSGTEFISKITMEALSGNPVLSNLWKNQEKKGMPHIDLSRDCELIVIAPATANFISKIATGAADDLLSTLCLARKCDLLIAPAMNVEMWNKPSTQRNLETIKKDGILVLNPSGGQQACGEIGIGRMAEPEDIFQAIQNNLDVGALSNINVTITAGGTFEKIDAVRGITNLSSGQMGFSMAKVALENGANVSLITGLTNIKPPDRCEVVEIISAKEMLDAVRKKISKTDIFISAAAVADYTAMVPVDYKIKKDSKLLGELRLTPTTDILAEVASSQNPPFCVGFAAESENLEENAKKKRIKKNIPLIVGNLAQDSIRSESCEIMLADKYKTQFFPRDSKYNQSKKIFNRIIELRDKKKN